MRKNLSFKNDTKTTEYFSQKTERQSEEEQENKTISDEEIKEPKDEERDLGQKSMIQKLKISPPVAP